MAYTIHKSDGTTVLVPDNAIDQDYYNPTGGSSGGVTPGLGSGTQLIGRNTIDYGAAIAQNFLQITENFASADSTQPVGAYALEGQLWYNKDESNLYVRITPGTLGADSMANWQKLVMISGAQTGTIPVTNPSTGTEKDGDTQISGSIISLWADGAWRQIYPAIYQ